MTPPRQRASRRENRAAGGFDRMEAAAAALQEAAVSTVVPPAPAVDPVPDEQPETAPAEMATAPVVVPPVPTPEPSPAAPVENVGPATAPVETVKPAAPAPARPARAKAAARPSTGGVRPTSNADCKGDPRRKHTVNLAPEPYKRLGELQLAETLRAGREVPLWPHIDAALAVLRRDQCPDGELTAWAERAEPYTLVPGDEYRQVGILLRRSVLEAVRTLRVRLRSVGAEGVDVQAVLSAAVTAYLDALEEQAGS